MNLDFKPDNNTVEEGSNLQNKSLCLNVLISGSSLSANKGAMAMTLVSAEQIRSISPGARVRLLSKYYEQDKAAAEEFSIELVDATPSKVVSSTLLRSIAVMVTGRIFRRLFYDSVLKAYAWADVVVDLGGVTFSDDRDWKGLMLSIGWIAPAVATDTPLAKLSQAIGPFKKKRVRWPARFLLKRCGLLITRGKGTTENVRRLLGANIEYHQCADVAFLLEKADSDAINDYLGSHGLPLREFVGVSPSAVVDRMAHSKGVRDKYRAAMVCLINHAREVSGLPVVMVPHAWPPGNSKREDMELCCDIFNQLDEKRNIFIVKDNLDAKMLKGIISRSEVFSACRFHAMIASLSSTVPTLVIGWGHKYNEIMELFGLEQFSCDFTVANEKVLCESFSSLWEDRDKYREQISISLDSVKDSAAKNFKLLRQFLCEKDLL